MAASNRRPRTIISSAMICNERNEEGSWVPCTYKRFQWNLMHPSSRGAFRKRCRSNVDYRHFWKGRIIEFRVSPGGKSITEVLVQHVYMQYSGVDVQGINIHDRTKLNCKSHVRRKHFVQRHPSRYSTQIQSLPFFLGTTTMGDTQSVQKIEIL